MTNLTNEVYYNNVSEVFNAAGLESRWLGEPRTYGMRIRYSFGK